QHTLAYGGEAGNHYVVEAITVLELLPERLGARAHRLVGKRLELRLERIDRLDAQPIAADPPVVGGAEELAREYADHAGDPFTSLQPSPAPSRGKTRNRSQAGSRAGGRRRPPGTPSQRGPRRRWPS